VKLPVQPAASAAAASNITDMKARANLCMAIPRLRRVAKDSAARPGRNFAGNESNCDDCWLCRAAGGDGGEPRLRLSGATHTKCAGDQRSTTGSARPTEGVAETSPILERHHLGRPMAPVRGRTRACVP
jgi:hypothetical protein